MKVWAVIKAHQRIRQDVVREFPGARPEGEDGWQEVISELCQALQLSRPVILQKHVQQLNRFGRTAFVPADFLEPVAFDKLDIELFPEKKKDGRDGAN